MFWFLKEKVFNFFTLILILSGLTFDSCFIHFFRLIEGNSAIEQQKCKVHEKRDRLLILKMGINYQIPAK